MCGTLSKICAFGTEMLMADRKYFSCGVRHKGFNQVMSFARLLISQFMYSFYSSWKLCLCHTVSEETSVFNKIDAVLMFLCCGPEALWVYANAKRAK